MKHLISPASYPSRKTRRWLLLFCTDGAFGPSARARPSVPDCDGQQQRLDSSPGAQGAGRHDIVDAGG